MFSGQCTAMTYGPPSAQVPPIAITPTRPSAKIVNEKAKISQDPAEPTILQTGSARDMDRTVAP